MENLPCSPHQSPSTFIKVTNDTAQLGCTECYLENKTYLKSENIKIIHIQKALVNPQYLISQFLEGKRLSKFYSNILTTQDEVHLKNVKNQINELKGLLDNLNNILTDYGAYLSAFKQEKLSQLTKLIDHEDFQKLCREPNAQFYEYFNKQLTHKFESLIKEGDGIPDQYQVDEKSPKIQELKTKFQRLFESLESFHQSFSPDFSSYFQANQIVSQIFPREYLNDILAQILESTKKNVKVKGYLYGLNETQNIKDFQASLKSIFVDQKPKNFILLAKSIQENIFGGFYSQNKDIQFIFSYTQKEIQKYDAKKQHTTPIIEAPYCYIDQNFKFQQRSHEIDTIKFYNQYGDFNHLIKEIEFYEIIIS